MRRDAVTRRFRDLGRRCTMALVRPIVTIPFRARRCRNIGAVALASALVLGCGSGGDGPTKPSDTARLEIAYSYNHDGLQGARDIYLVSADGKSKRLLVDLGGDESQPAWSPDGRTLLVSQESSTGRLLLVNEDGSSPREIAGVGSNIARWSPDGAWIAFGRAFGYDTSINVMHVDGSARRAIKPGLPCNDLVLPSWSRTGTIAFVCDGGATSIWTMNLDGSQPVQLTPGPADESPAWSPDGTRLAFGSQPALGEVYQIFVINADGSGRRQLTHDTAASNFRPTWSPDGQWVLFEHWDAATGCSFVKVPAVGGNAITVVQGTANGVCGGASWR